MEQGKQTNKQTGMLGTWPRSPTAGRMDTTKDEIKKETGLVIFKGGAGRSVPQEE